MSVRLKLLVPLAGATLLAGAALTACDDDDSASARPIVADAYAQFTKSDLGAVYFDITGAPGEDDELVGVSTDIATAEIHESVTEGATGSMRHVDSVEIPAGETVVFEPGGYHVMLTDVTDLPAEGDTFEIELEFGNAGTLTVEVDVDLVLASGDEGDDDATASGEHDDEH